MSAMMISFCALVAVPEQGGASVPAIAHESPGSRSSYELRTAVRDSMRREAMAETFTDRSDAIGDLCDLFVEIASSRMMSETLRDRYLGKVRRRLQRTQRELEIQVARHRRNDSRSLSSGEASSAERHGGAAADNGQALVELIQTTISPGVWDVNGGEATIFYFAPVHALVVKAPGEVHRRAGRLLENIRRAGN